MNKESNDIHELQKLPTYNYKHQEIKIENSGEFIYGVAYIPENEKGHFPLVIFSHGLGDSYISNLQYFELLAKHGIATYSFDFRGGGGDKSNGDTTKMSVMTEVSDLEKVLSASKKWNFVDKNSIVLIGHSQGGIVTAIVAARHKDEISGAVLLSPAFSLTDEIHKMFHSLSEVPEKFHFLYIDAGRIYAEDIWNYDLYSEIDKYDKKILLIHGNMDDLVPITFSEKALKIYKDAELAVIQGAGHEFKDNEITKAIKHIIDYLQIINVIKK